MTRTLPLAVLVVLTTTTPAWAATGAKPPGVRLPPQTEQQKLDAYLGVARSYWPASPCAGREHITLNADAEIAARAPEHPDAKGYGDPEGCRVYLRGGLDAITFCLVLAHELGHTARATHAGEGIMRADPERVGACADPTLAFSVDWYRTVASLPGAGRGWHIVRAAGDEEAYVARHRGFLDRAWRAWPPAGGEAGWATSPVVIRRRARPTGRGRARTPTTAQATHQPAATPQRPPQRSSAAPANTDSSVSR